MNELSTLLGSYNAPFFSIHLYNDDLSTYIHEYIHHIQNITTPYGLMYYNARSIYFLHKFIDNPQANLYPDICELWDNKKQFTEKIIREVGTVCCHQYSKSQLKSIHYDCDEEKRIKYGRRYITKVTLIVDVNGEDRVIPFSTRMIKENMARLIQKRCFPDSNIADEITYYMIEDIIRMYSPEFPVTPSNVVALCDLSMLSDAPVSAFFGLLDWCRSNDYTSDSSKDLYAKVKNTPILTEGGYFYPLDLFSKIIDGTFSAVDAFYTVFCPGKAVNTWIKGIISDGVIFRTKNFSFFGEVMDTSHSASEAQHLLMGINMLIGTTIVAKENGDYVLPENIDPNVFVRIVAFEEYTLQILKATPCRLQDFCSKYCRNDTVEGAKKGPRKTRGVMINSKEDYDRVKRQGHEVVNNQCLNPMSRDTYHNLCPFTFIRRDILAVNLE